MIRNQLCVGNELPSASFTFLADLLHSRSGLVIGEEKLYLLETRLASLLREEGLPDLAALARRLAADSDCALEQRVIEKMATHETLFFRDGKPFEHLRTTGLPALLQSRPPGSLIRIWSAATATGQEAYSIAMTVAEGGLCEHHRFSILGTDLAREPIARAIEGSYTQYEVQRGLGVLQLIRHFTREGEQWRVKPELRALCEFQVCNLLDDLSGIGTFDIIFCRNVLMYFDVPTRKRVLQTLADHLAPEGQLYLGLAEVASEVDELFERRWDSPAVFQPRSRERR